MLTYRFYPLSNANHITGLGMDHAFDGDAQALEHAATLAEGHAIAVWEWQRLVGYVAARIPESQGYLNREELIAAREQLTRQIAVLEGERHSHDRHPENVAKIRTALGEIEDNLVQMPRPSGGHR